MFYSVETKRLLIWKCQKHYLIITRIITSKLDNFSNSDKNISTFVSTLANFWKFFVRNTSSALYHFSYFSRIDYFTKISLILYHILYHLKCETLDGSGWVVVAQRDFPLTTESETSDMSTTDLYGQICCWSSTLVSSVWCPWRPQMLRLVLRLLLYEPDATTFCAVAAVASLCRSTRLL